MGGSLSGSGPSRRPSLVRQRPFYPRILPTAIYGTQKGRPKDALNFSDPLPIDERPLCRSPRRNAGFRLLDRSWRLALALKPRAPVPLRRARGSSFERAQLIFERVRAWHCRARIVV
jgi:hypothetical protein